MQKTALIRKLGIAALDFLYPPRCLICTEAVDKAGAVCARCWGQLTFITVPYCAQCGLPFDYDVGANAICGACLSNQPAFDRARTALVYDAASRALLIGLKHNHIQNVITLSTWMRHAANELIQDTDIIAAVPLHRWRLLKRGYNQASLLAHRIGKDTGKTVIPDLLLRRRATISQGGLSRIGRQRNVRGAFRLNPVWQETVKQATVMLVDDVFTTGATLGECCRVLRKHGAAKIYVLTAARVI